MSYSCESCNKTFLRPVDLDRHKNRKIPCDRQLICNRCGEIFKHIGLYKQHINKKKKCQNINELHIINRKIKLEKLIRENLKNQLLLQQKEMEREFIKKTRRKRIENKCDDNLNDSLVNDPINNYTLNTSCITKAKCIINYELNELTGICSDNDVFTTFINFIKMHFIYSAKDYPENNCICVTADKRIWVNLNNEMKTYEDSRLSINKIISEQLSWSINTFTQYDDEYAYANGLQYKLEVLNDQQIKMLNSVIAYIRNIKNNCNIKKAIIEAFKAD